MKVIALATTLLAISAFAAADSLRATAERVGNKVCAAIESKSPSAMGRAIQPNITKDFKYTESGQAMGYNAMMQHMQSGMAMLNHVSAHYTVLSANEHGMTGMTRARHAISGTMVGPDKKRHAIKMKGESHDTWVKVGGKWKMATMTWISQKMTMDGKPFDPSAAPMPASTTKLSK